MKFVNGRIVRTEKEDCVMTLEAVVNAVLILDLDDNFDENNYQTQLHKFCEALYDRGVRINDKDVKL